jgi:hypothetical protein
MASKILSFAAGAGGLALALAAITGCQSTGAEYISPRVEGRVLDAQTHQPLSRVHVLRTPAGSQVYDNPYQLHRGEQRMGAPLPAYTGKNGRFVIDSEKALVLFAQVNWFSIDLTFEHSGYEQFVTNYTLVSATNLPSGEPLIRTGDILLQRTQNKAKQGSS